MNAFQPDVFQEDAFLVVGVAAVVAVAAPQVFSVYVPGMVRSRGRQATRPRPDDDEARLLADLF